MLGRLAGHGVVCMQGRFHFYEGHPMSHIAAPVRVMKALGVETLLVTKCLRRREPRFPGGRPDGQ